LQVGIRRLGFNVEELEGQNRTSSLVGSNPGIETAARRFWERLYERGEQTQRAISIREFERAEEAIRCAPASLTAEEAVRRLPQVSPLGIVSADWCGNLSTFSPELLGIKNLHYGDFTFTNIRERELKDMVQAAEFKKVAQAISEGVRMCRATCQYFDLCGGGAPSNKYFENGSFASTETMYCRTSIQMPIDVVLAAMERRLGLVG